MCVCSTIVKILDSWLVFPFIIWHFFESLCCFWMDKSNFVVMCLMKYSFFLKLKSFFFSFLSALWAARRIVFSALFLFQVAKFVFFSKNLHLHKAFASFFICLLSNPVISNPTNDNFFLQVRWKYFNWWRKLWLELLTSLPSCWSHCYTGGSMREWMSKIPILFLTLFHFLELHPVSSIYT